MINSEPCAAIQRVARVSAWRTRQRRRVREAHRRLCRESAWRVGRAHGRGHVRAHGRRDSVDNSTVQRAGFRASTQHHGARLRRSRGWHVKQQRQRHWRRQGNSVKTPAEKESFRSGNAIPNRVTEPAAMVTTTGAVCTTRADSGPCSALPARSPRRPCCGRRGLSPATAARRLHKLDTVSQLWRCPVGQQRG